MTNEVEIHDVHGEIHRQFGAEPDKNKGLSEHTGPRSAGGGHKGHGMLMLVCCIPMLVLAVVLVVSGVVSAGFLITAVACTAMMFVMMRMMPGH